MSTMVPPPPTSTVQVGTVCTYTPTLDEQPMAQGNPQAAIVTGWDAVNSKADLIVFPKDANFGYFKDNVAEGTDAGSFQQLGKGSSASGASASAAHSSTSKK